MTLDIPNFIINSRTDADYWTHVSLTEPKGRLLFDYEQTDDFFEEYGKIYKKEKYGIAERPENVIPVLVDIDLKSNDKKQLYTEEMLNKTIEVYQNVLKDLIKNIDNNYLTCICLEKPGYMSGNIYKNGFHLHFPKIFLQKKDHTDFLIPRVKQELKDVFQNYNIDSVVDSGYTTSPWLLLGCVKDLNYDGYKINKIYDNEMNIVSIDTLLDYKIFDKDTNQIPITNNNLEKNLPRILSVRVWGRECYIHELREELETIKINQQKKKNRSKHKKSKYTNDKNLSVKLLTILGSDRSDDHNNNYIVGMILYNIFNGSKEGLKHWIDSSQKIQKPHKTRGTPGNLNVKYYEKEWNRMDHSDYTIGTLIHYARLDNPKNCEKVMNEEASNYLNTFVELGGTHYDIAKTLHTKYASMFVCSSLGGKNGEWYMFENNSWKSIEEGIDLRRLISTEVIVKLRQKNKEIDRELQQLRKNYFKQDDNDTENNSDDDTEYNSDDDDINVDRQQHKNQKNYIQEREKLEKQKEKIFKTIQECKKATFKAGVMTEARELFYDSTFRRKLGQNKTLIAFNNGVYDIKRKIFREGLPSDYMYKKMPIDYKPYKQSDQEIKNLYRFLQQIFPNKRVLKYALDYHSDLFEGGNPRKIALIYQGDGNNGKSIFQSVVEGMFGSEGVGYSAKLNTTFLSGKKQASSGAQPDLDRLRHGCRLVVLQEPSKQEVINTALLKELTGNDTMYARTLYKEGGEFLPLFKPVIICNDLPQLSSNEPAIWSRLRILPFESKFDTNEAPKTYEEQLEQKIFPRDEDLNNKLHQFMGPLAFTLIETYNKRNGKPYEEPPEVLNATNRYQNQCDTFRQYLDERIYEEQTKTKSDNTRWIRLSDMYPDFKAWWNESISNKKLPNKNELKDYLNNPKVWGKFTLPASKWYGFRFKTIEDEISEYE
jgi:P4 family phage/plasmid primase-like protien